MSDWDAMLAEFRALGGVAQNVCRCEGPNGPGIFAIDPTRQMRLNVPDALLVDTGHVRFEDGVLRLADEAPHAPRARTFIESYYADFSWGPQSDCTAFVTARDGMPAQLRRLLAFHLNTGAVTGNRAEQIQDRFLVTRRIRKNGTSRLMLLMELINHAPHGMPWDMRDGIGFCGHFESEAFMRYRKGDALDFAWTWGFVSEEPRAFSLRLLLRDSPHGVLVTREAFRGAGAEAETPREPHPGLLHFPRLLLANRENPGAARAQFLERLQDRADAGVLFDRIVAANQAALTQLERAAQAWDTALGAMLANACARQQKILASG
jgi:hypothetical protein